MDTEFMLTTIDNPWNPYTHWDEWYAWDQAAGYNTPGLLARLSAYSFDLSDTDQELLIQETIDEIVNQNVSGMYIKISKDEIPNAA